LPLIRRLVEWPDETRLDRCPPDRHLLRIRAGDRCPSAEADVESHTLAIRTLLLHRVPIQDGVIAAGGWDKVHFHRPVRPGDELWLEVTWVAKRRSTSKPDRGIVTALMKLINQDGDVVLSHEDIIFMRRRSSDRTVP
jgi:hypothetical protein